MNPGNKQAEVKTMAIKGINFPAAPAKINYRAWNTEKNTRRAAAKLRLFGNLIDSGSIASFGGRAEAVVREYWRVEMPKQPQLCNHNSREAIASWSFWQKVDFLNNWGISAESTRLSPLPFMVMSQLAKETGKNGGVSSEHGIRVQSLVETAIKPIFEVMAKNLFSFAGIRGGDATRN